MARLLTSGFETGTPYELPYPVNAISGGVGCVTAVKRSGDYSLRLPPTANRNLRYNGLPAVADRDYYMRVFFFCNTPSASGYLLRFAAVSNSLSVGVRMTSGRLLQVTDSAQTQIGASSAAVTDQAWHRLELRYRYNSAGTARVTCRINGTEFLADSAVTGTPVGALENFFLGYGGTASTEFWVDDIALNDDQGANQNSWPGDGQVDMLRPISDNARTGWTDNAGATTGLWDSVDSPPVGGTATAPVLRTAGTPVYTASSVANGALTPAIPTKQIGDLLLAFVYTTETSATCTTPTGWTLLSGFPMAHTTADGGKLWVFAKVADGTEGAAADTVSFTLGSLTTGTSGTPAGAVIMAYKGVDTSGGAQNAIDGTPTQSNNAAGGASVTAPSITTAVDNSLVVEGAIKKAVQGTWTPPAVGFTENLDTNTTSGEDMAFTIAVGIKAVAGTVSAQTFTHSLATSTLSLGFALALKSGIPKMMVKDSNAGATDDYDANVESYDTALGTGKQIVLTQAFVTELASAASLNGAVRSVSNPADGAETSFTYDQPLADFPTGWRNKFTSPQYAPSVTPGTSPVVRVGKRSASATVAYATMLGLIVEYLPSAAQTIAMSASATASGTLALTAPPTLPLAASSATATGSLALTAPPTLALAAASATASGSLALTAPPKFTLTASASASGSATITVTAQISGSASAVASGSLALTAPTTIPLNAASAVATGSFALTAPTTIPLNASTATASGSLALTAPVTLSLAAASATSSGSLALTAANRLLLNAASAVASGSLALTAPTTIPLNAASALASGSLALTAPNLLQLAASSAAASGSLFLTAPVTLTLAPSSASASGSLALTAPPRIDMSASASSDGSLTLTVTAILSLAPSNATASGSAELRAPPTFTMAASATATATLALTAPPTLTLAPASAAATASLVLSTSSGIVMSATATASGSLALAAPPTLSLSATATASGSLDLSTPGALQLAPSNASASGALHLTAPVALTLTASATASASASITVAALIGGTASATASGSLSLSAPTTLSLVLVATATASGSLVLTTPTGSALVKSASATVESTNTTIRFTGGASVGVSAKRAAITVRVADPDVILDESAVMDVG